MLQINDLSLRFFQDQFPNSWGRPYLARRFCTDLLEHPHFRPGQAQPAGRLWSTTYAAAVSPTRRCWPPAWPAQPSTGALIDRFRDRAVFPIAVGGQILDFLGRRHPAVHKGAQLFGAVEQHLSAGAVPVIVEGQWTRSR